MGHENYMQCLCKQFIGALWVLPTSETGLLASLVEISWTENFRVRTHQFEHLSFGTLQSSMS